MSDLSGTKPAVASTGVWGGIIAVIAGIAGLFGYSITEADQASLVQSVSAGMATLGGLIAVWGRVRASKKIG
jgi:hypothetical protein